jgi:hypothetical protein
VAAPTFVSYGASVFNTTTTPKTVSITVLTGDRIVVQSFGGNAGGPVSTAPTGGGLTYAQVANLGTTSSHARTIAWTATATADATFSVSAVRPGNTNSGPWGVAVWVWRDSDGFGAVGTGGPTSNSNSAAITTTGANSGLCGGANDWNSIDGTTRTRRTINSSTGTEDTYFRDAVEYTVYSQRYADAGAAGAKTFGYSAPTGQQTSIIAVEVLGTAGGAPAIPPILVMAPLSR